ncbi:uncharacterized protein LOC143536703 [Bidens hawaiensis]|uniref:uncharacterized protein LOC143536703 n=1 Tax=Bidens hawaiensis TaxID=980011 RepID=UPI00404991F3
MPNNEQHLAFWKRCNDMVISWILNTLSNDVSDSVLYAKTDQILWNELNSRYGQIKSNWDELNAVKTIPSCTCGAAYSFAKSDEDQRLIQLIVGLNPSYDSIRSTILMMQPLPSINCAYGILMQYEKQKKIYTTIDFIASSATMNASSEGPISRGTWKNRRTSVCTHCKSNGHSDKKCYNLIGFPKDFNLTKEKKFSNLTEDQGKSGQD